MPVDHNPEILAVEGPAAPPPSMRAALLGSLAAAVLALLLFSWLADRVFEGGTRRFDEAVRGAVHQFATPALTGVMAAISTLGSSGLLVVCAGATLIFLRLRWRWATLWLVLTLAGALVLDITLKYGFQRARPVPFFGAAPHTYSFPSGHALMSFCIYGVLAGLASVRIRSTAARVLIWAAAATLVAAIGLSRIYLGVHYPSDVLAGYLAATVWVSTLIAADRLRKHRKLRRSQ